MPVPRGRARAVPCTRSSSGAPGSAPRKLAVGGTVPRCTASTVSAASTAPAAPIMCPVTPLVEVTAGPPPKRECNTAPSVRSLSRVPVPCALTWSTSARAAPARLSACSAALRSCRPSGSGATVWCASADEPCPASRARTGARRAVASRPRALQHQHSGALRQHEAIPLAVERTRGAGRITGPAGEGARPGEGRRAQRGHHGVAAPGDGDVAGVGVQQHGRDGQRGRTRGAGRRGVQYRSVRSQVDGEPAGGHVRQEGRQGERGDRTVPGGEEPVVLLLVGAHATGRRTEDHRDPCAVPGARLHGGVPHRLPRRHQGELGESVVPPGLGAAHVPARLEPLDPAREPDRRGEWRVRGPRPRWLGPRTPAARSARSPGPPE